MSRRGRRTHHLSLCRSSRRASTNPPKETAADATCSKNYSQMGLPRGEYFPFVLTSLPGTPTFCDRGFCCFCLLSGYGNEAAVTPGGISYPTPLPSQFLLVLLLDLSCLVSTQFMSHDSTDCLWPLLSRPLVLASLSVAMLWCCHILSGLDEGGSQPSVDGLSTPV